MGLDIYLYTAEQARINAQQDQYWEDVEKGLIDAEQTPEPRFSLSTDVSSVLHPDNICNRRYLRSFYNDNGFNSAAKQMIGERGSFYWIFEPVIGSDPEPYRVTLGTDSVPALRKCAARAGEVASALRVVDPLRVAEANAMVGASGHLWPRSPGPAEVLEWYRSEQIRSENHQFKHLREGGYSSARGTVFGFESGIEVLAATVGEYYGSPAALMVFRAPEQRDYLVASAEVAAEFAEEAISLIEADGSAMMSWSG